MLVLKSYFSKFVKARPKDSHKYNYGHVLIIAGSDSMFGAAILTAKASLNSGAGLVTLCVNKDLNKFVISNLPECMVLEKRSYPAISKYIKERKVNTLVIGPGLSRNKDTVSLVRKIVGNIDLPLVLDADGLNAFGNLVKKDMSISYFKNRESELILTPHPREMARLLNIKVDLLLENREHYLREFARVNSVIALIKGNHTLISDGSKVLKNSTGNPGMATAGSGDVLAGILGAILSSRDIFKESIIDLVAFAVFIHGASGDLAAKDKSEIGLVSSDIIKYLPRVFKSLGFK